jgi:antitoxin HicB
MRFAYPACLIEQPEGGFVVSFPDVPEALTQGETEAEALEMAADALVAGLSFYVEAGRRLPAPSAAEGRALVSVPVLEATKLALHEAMLDRGVGNVELGRAMDMDEKSVRRLRDPVHRSHIGQVERALRTLGRRVVVEVRAA